MAYLVLVILTLLSCLLYEWSGLTATLKKLLASYRRQFAIMSDKGMDDEVKQKELMTQVSQQVILILKLIFGILLFIAPFLSLFLLQKLSSELKPEILVTWWGLLIPIVTVVGYILIKKSYGKIFGNR